MNEYCVRTLVDGKIVETPLTGRVFDVVFKTEKGNISVNIEKDGTCRVHAEKSLIVYPEAGNSVSLETK